MTSDAFGQHSDIYQYIYMYSREWAIEFHPNLPAATPPKSGWYKNDGKLSAITITKEEALPQANNKSFIVTFYWAVKL